jgi:hypothetical protein
MDATAAAFEKKNLSSKIPEPKSKSQKASDPYGVSVLGDGFPVARNRFDQLYFSSDEDMGRYEDKYYAFSDGLGGDINGKAKEGARQ